MSSVIPNKNHFFSSFKDQRCFFLPCLIDKASRKIRSEEHRFCPPHDRPCRWKIYEKTATTNEDILSVFFFIYLSVCILLLKERRQFFYCCCLAQPRDPCFQR